MCLFLEGKLAQKEFEIRVQFGKAYWKLFKFVVNEISKDLYLIFPIPEVGLKLSIHPPRPHIFPKGHIHWSSHKLGIHEDINAGPFSPEYLKESALEYLESFKYYQPSGDEDVMVLHSNFLAGAFTQKALKTGERTVVDFGRVMEGIMTGTFYQTKARKLPLLIREMERNNLTLNQHEDLSICALSEGRIIIPLNSKTMIEFDQHKLMDKLGGTGLGSLFNPMQKAIETVSRVNPNAFQKWLPISDIEQFCKETMNTLKHSEPKIVNF